MQIFIQIIVAIALAYISYKLTPKPRTNAGNIKPADLTTPTLSAGRPYPVIFGRMRIQDPNDLWHGGKQNIEIRK